MSSILVAIYNCDIRHHLPWKYVYKTLKKKIRGNWSRLGTLKPNKIWPKKKQIRREKIAESSEGDT